MLKRKKWLKSLLISFITVNVLALTLATLCPHCLTTQDHTANSDQSTHCASQLPDPTQKEECHDTQKSVASTCNTCTIQDNQEPLSNTTTISQAQFIELYSPQNYLKLTLQPQLTHIQTQPLNHITHPSWIKTIRLQC